MEHQRFPTTQFFAAKCFKFFLVSNSTEILSNRHVILEWYSLTSFLSFFVYHWACCIDLRGTVQAQACVSQFEGSQLMTWCFCSFHKNSFMMGVKIRHSHHIGLQFLGVGQEKSETRRARLIDFMLSSLNQKKKKHEKVNNSFIL
jgi:hypothetical protein